MEIIMGIIMSIAVSIIAIAIFVIISLKNRKELEELDDFSRETEEREDVPEEQERGADRDIFGQKKVSADDTVELDYIPKYEEHSEEENNGYMRIIFSARQNILSGEFEKARKELEKAAKMSKKGNYELGKYHYYCGNDNQRAKVMFSSAYNNGIKNAAYWLGLIEEENGNAEIARDWYNKGAEKGDVDSIVKLGKIAEKENDYGSAESFYLKGVYTKDAKIIYRLISLYFKQNMIEKVVEWQQKLLNEKQVIGLTSEILRNIEFMLGSEKDRKFIELIHEGYEFLNKKDYGNAQKLFFEAADYNERGYLTLAKSYYAIGDGEKAKSTFEKAYELGVREAAYYLGEHSDVKEDNVEEAEKWYKIGQEAGDMKSIYELAMIYEYEGDYGKSEEEIYRMFEQSANMKYGPAMGDMMFFADEENEGRAKEWASRILNETGIIELDRSTLKDVQEVLEGYGSILDKDDEIDYDENMIYFIKKALIK